MPHPAVPNLTLKVRRGALIRNNKAHAQPTWSCAQLYKYACSTCHRDRLWVRYPLRGSRSSCSHTNALPTSMHKQTQNPICTSTDASQRFARLTIADSPTLPFRSNYEPGGQSTLLATFPPLRLRHSHCQVHRARTRRKFGTGIFETFA